MSKTIELIASGDSKAARKQFIARVTGRGSGRFPFEFEFLGKAGGRRGEYTEATVDEPGLYVVRNSDRKGSEDVFLILWQDGEDLAKVSIDESRAMTLAKNLTREAIQSAGREAAIVSAQSAISNHEGKIAAGDLEVEIKGEKHKRADRVAHFQREIARLTATITSADFQALADVGVSAYVKFNGDREAAIAEIRRLMNVYLINASEI